MRWFLLVAVELFFLLLDSQHMMASHTRYHSYFLQRLPNNVHTILASTSNTTSLDELAQLADKIVDVVSQTLHLEAVNHTPTDVRNSIAHSQSWSEVHFLLGIHSCRCSETHASLVPISCTTSACWWTSNTISSSMG